VEDEVITVSFRVPKKLIDKLDIIRMRYRMNRNEVFRQALIEYIAKYGD